MKVERPKSALFVGLLFVSVFGGTWGILRTFHSAPVGAAGRASPLNWDGRQVLVVLLGSADCAFTTDGRTKVAFEHIVAYERAMADSNTRVNTVGVAIDADPIVGLRVLQEFGTFDEVVAGGGLLNTGFVHYSVRDLAGILGVPQVLVVSRMVRGSSNSIEVGPDSLHRRFVGVDAIAAWAARLERLEGNGHD